MPPATTLPDSAWRALRRRRFLLTGWPWRALLHTLTTLLVWITFAIPAIPVAVPLGGAVDQLTRGRVVAACALVLLSLSSGFVLLPLLATPLLALDRWRAVLVDPAPLPASASSPRGPGAWIKDRWLTARRWREAGYVVAALVLDALLLLGLGIFGTTAGALVVAPFLASKQNPVEIGAWQTTDPSSAWPLAIVGVLLVTLVVYAWTGAACLGVGLLRRTLESGRDEALAEELTEVGASRTRLVESFDSERRRIERDLHDGAQQRLVTLAMRLGVSRLEVVEALGADHPAAVGVAAAHEQAKVLMDELRAFVRGIHPQVLTDVGLVAALDQLTAAMPLQVTVTSTLRHRPAPTVETTAYFAASEALTNVVRHSGAGHAWVTVERQGADLVLEVRDDGHGGAVARPHSGLTWMADRLAAVNGTLALSSPPGGPTVVHMRIPGSR